MSTKFSEDVHQKCLQALHAGGFVCLLPHVIDPAWRDPAPRLAGFPITICFTALSPESGRLPSAGVLVSCYHFDPSTYYEDALLRAMSYYPNPRSGYRVVLVYHKPELQWEGGKLEGDRLLLEASGVELDRFVIQLTMRGIEPDEPAQEIGSADDTAQAGVYLFTPKPH